MAGEAKSGIGEADLGSVDRARRREYHAAFRKFAKALPAETRVRINGSAAPDFATSRTFALPVNEESSAYSSEPEDSVLATIVEIAEIPGGLAKMALFVHDRIGGLSSVTAVDRERRAVARILDAKDARLEAELVSVAIGMSLHGNDNGYALAKRYGMSPQAIHESLGETCGALGVPKPLSKANTARYSKTQYSHNLRRK
jgi:hypothetical protein